MHPVLFQLKLPLLGPFPIYSYGAMLLIAFVLSTALAVHLGSQRGYNREYITDLCMWAILAGIAGCRIGYVLQYPAAYLVHPLQAFNLREGGMTITGGVTLSCLLVYIYFKRRGVPVMNVLDFLSAPLLVGMAWGRLGCLLHGCCYGKLCDPHVLGALTYPEGTFGPGVPAGPRYPSPLYELLMDCLLLGILLWLLPRVKFAGQAFYTVFAGYGIIRFLDEMTREIDVWWGPLGMYEWIALGFFAFGALGLLGAFGKPPVVTELFPEGPRRPDREDSPPSDPEVGALTSGVDEAVG